MTDTPKPKPTHILTVRYTTGGESTHALRLDQRDGEPPCDVWTYDETSYQIDFGLGGHTWFQKCFIQSYQLRPWFLPAEVKDRAAGERKARARREPAKEDVPDALRE